MENTNFVQSEINNQDLKFYHSCSKCRKVIEKGKALEGSTQEVLSPFGGTMTFTPIFCSEKCKKKYYKW